jgi:hypothetical protein
MPSVVRENKVTYDTGLNSELILVGGRKEDILFKTKGETQMLQI